MDAAASVGRAVAVGVLSASLVAWLAVATTIVVGAPFHTSLPDDAFAITALAACEVAVTLGVALELLPVCVMLDDAVASGVPLKLTVWVECDVAAAPRAALELVS